MSYISNHPDRLDQDRHQENIRKIEGNEGSALGRGREELLLEGRQHRVVHQTTYLPPHSVIRELEEVKQGLIDEIKAYFKEK